MPERRTEDRPGSPDRRTFPRPPLWLTLALLLAGIALLVFARVHRDRVSTQFSDVILAQQSTPADVKKLKEELATMDLTRDALEKELKSREELVGSLKSENFYLSVDTRARKLRFYYGDTVLRETDITIGESKKVESNGRRWTFVPVKGTFPVQAKIVDYAWPAPEWVYAMNGQPAPALRPTVAGGLGKYVIFLNDGYVIHTPPVEGSLLKGVKPGSYMIDETTMRAIWPRIHKDKTQVYIY